ncbi:MAG: hypothetical protein GXO26_02810 [Crenarchaeota archaeon]|nr:hypothetical protein [Thermoproteota archaeon]
MRLPVEYLLFLLYREKRSSIISLGELKRLIMEAHRNGLDVPQIEDVVIALTYMKLGKIIDIDGDKIRILDPVTLIRIGTVLEDPLLHFTVDSKLRDITEQARKITKLVISSVVNEKECKSK